MKLIDLILKIEYDQRRLTESQAHASALANAIKDNSIRVFNAVRGDHAIGASQVDFACGGTQYRVDSDGGLRRINELPAVDEELDVEGEPK